ncbi:MULTISPECIES: DMT family transporter [Brevibacterium]|uniref:Small multidrug resistance pump n=2 Tax=Brevibacterium TaxID=1696 RepID=A0A1H1PDG7_BRESA|nr:SMR family transporter [Brevibacterium sandarakinum]SDS09177.1 small multidrug resistance pump [Brevibacterium sandarakinum]
MRKKWALLTGAVIAEVAGTLMLRATIENPLWIPLVVISYALAFTLLGFALRLGLPIGVVYGTWAAFGVALVAVLGMVVFGDTLSIGAMIGIAAIIAGVVLIETSTTEKPPEAGIEVNA